MNYDEFLVLLAEEAAEAQPSLFDMLEGVG